MKSFGKYKLEKLPALCWHLELVQIEGCACTWARSEKAPCAQLWLFVCRRESWGRDINCWLECWRLSDTQRHEVAQSCATLCDSMDCSLSVGSSVHGIFQARVLGWVAISFCRGSSWTWDHRANLWRLGFFLFFSVRFFHVFKEILSNTQLTCKLKETSVATKNTGCTKLGHKSY